METRCPAFENEFKHTEARVTEVSGSVNFSDKFHEVHFGWRTRLYVCTLEARIVLQPRIPGATKHSSNGNHHFDSLHSMSRSIEITSSFHAQIHAVAIRTVPRAVIRQCKMYKSHNFVI